MRNLITKAIASLSLATLLAGTASAADWTSSRNAQSLNTNAAEQSAVERDMASNWLHRGGPGVVIAEGDNQTVASSRLNQSASAEGSQSWLDRSPAGTVVGHFTVKPGSETASLGSYRDND